MIYYLFTGSYGIPEPWYFFVTRKYWLPKTNVDNVVKKNDDTRRHESIATNDNSIEAEPIGLRLGVDIVHLSKVYSNGTKAVSCRFDFFESNNIIKWIF